MPLAMALETVLFVLSIDIWCSNEELIECLITAFITCQRATINTRVRWTSVDDAVVRCRFWWSEMLVIKRTHHTLLTSQQTLESFEYGHRKKQ